MNKFGVVLGIAAVATLAGCKDPDYRRAGSPAVQTEVKNIDTAEARPIAIEPVAAPKCTCPPGTKHSSPCTCGAPDCKCIVETKPVVVADLAKPAEPVYTVYVVQNGDYLAKISKKYNVTISSIKRLNPSLKGDVVRVGQKLKLPGKIDVQAPAAVSSAAAGGAAVAVAAKGAKKSAKKGFAPYAGATKEYAVKNGDTLGSIAYGNGINIRQLKELNNLSTDSLKIGQKLKIPAEKVVKQAKPAAKSAAAPEAAKPVEAAKPADAVKPAEPAAPAAEAAPAAAAPAAAPAAPAAPEAEAKSAESAPAATYVVQEGDDMTGISIRWGVSAAAIRELNNLSEADKLVPGQIIKLPADAQQ